MPTPTLYKDIASKTSPYKWYFLGLPVIGGAICFFSILISLKSPFNYFPMFGFGQLIILWGCGLFLITNWYGNQLNATQQLPKPIVTFNEWFSSIFLNCWFSVGSTGLIWFILDSGSEKFA